VFNWAATRIFGTELAERVFRYVKHKGKAKTYYDTGDPSPNKKKIPELIQKVLLQGLVDIMSVNENEVFLYANNFGIEHCEGKLNNELAKNYAQTLARNLPAQVDLHTTVFAGSFSKKREVVVPTFHVSALRATGAGDAWNAGNILGYALELPDSYRLTLANAVAAYYVSSLSAEHPNVTQLLDFCSKQTI
jgi:sugar/nucleoside kinase (ribokinase family)